MSRKIAALWPRLFVTWSATLRSWCPQSCFRRKPWCCSEKLFSLLRITFSAILLREESKLFRRPLEKRYRYFRKFPWAGKIVQTKFFRRCFRVCLPTMSRLSFDSLANRWWQKSPLGVVTLTLLYMVWKYNKILCSLCQDIVELEMPCKAKFTKLDLQRI